MTAVSVRKEINERFFGSIISYIFRTGARTWGSSTRDKCYRGEMYALGSLNAPNGIASDGETETSTGGISMADDDGNDVA